MRCQSVVVRQLFDIMIKEGWRLKQRDAMEVVNVLISYFYEVYRLTSLPFIAKGLSSRLAVYAS